MGFTYTELKLENLFDRNDVERNLLNKEEVRTYNVEIPVDTGAWMLSINEEIQQALGLKSGGKMAFQFADGNNTEFDLVGPIAVSWKHKTFTMDAVVLPGNAEPLMGVIPLEIMNLNVDPVTKQLYENPIGSREYQYKLK